MTMDQKNTPIVDLTYSNSEDSATLFFDLEEEQSRLTNQSASNISPPEPGVASRGLASGQLQEIIYVKDEHERVESVTKIKEQHPSASCGSSSHGNTRSLRKRSRYQMYANSSPPKRNDCAARNGPFVETSSSSDESNVPWRRAPKRGKASKRAIAFKDHRRSQFPREEGSGPATREAVITDTTKPETIRTASDKSSAPLDSVQLAWPRLHQTHHQQLAKTASVSLPASTTQQEASKARDGNMSKEQLASINRRARHDELFSKHSAHTGVSSSSFEHSKPTENVTESATGHSSLLRSEERTRKSKAADRIPAKNKHQQWLKHSNKILSQSFKHVGAANLPKELPALQKPQADKIQLSAKPLASVESAKEDPAQPCQRLHPSPDQDNPRTPETRRASATATPTPPLVPASTSALSLSGSLIPENDRCVIDWRDGGMSWDDMIQQWQKKTGSVATQCTLEKRYKAAKRSVLLELNGMKMARLMRQGTGPITLNDQAAPGYSSMSHELQPESHDNSDITPGEQSPRPTTGGKCFSNEAFVARMAELREIHAEEERLESEQANGFFRDQSPQPGEQGDPIYYCYHIVRREWYNAEGRNDEQAGPWYRIINSKAEFSNIFEANAAAMQEATETRNQIGPHMRFLKAGGELDQDEMYYWTFEGQDDRGYEVKVVRELAASGAGYTKPESKAGWFRKRVWIIKKRTETRAGVGSASVPGTAGIDTMTHEERLNGVYTVLDQANREAADVLLYSIVKKNSARLDEVAKLSTLQPKLANKCDELEEEGRLFNEELERERDGTSIRVWVEQDYLLGPRNI